MYSRTRVTSRIIPALAGNTRDRQRRERRTPDHPRSRGEYLIIGLVHLVAGGSSPLSRGIRPCCQICGNGGRIIPALAGNTIDSLHHLCPISDHPRSRGEYSKIFGTRGAQQGSSPLSRGIRRGFPQCHAGGGIIPALAGNTRFGELHSVSSWDHPRSRGEYVSWHRHMTVPSGSSPLSRGIRGSCDRCRSRNGIIPALAGNTTAHLSTGRPGRDHPRSRGEYAEGAPIS